MRRFAVMMICLGVGALGALSLSAPERATAAGVANYGFNDTYGGGIGPLNYLRDKVLSAAVVREDMKSKLQSARSSHSAATQRLTALRRKLRSTPRKKRVRRARTQRQITAAKSAVAAGAKSVSDHEAAVAFAEAVVQKLKADWDAAWVDEERRVNVMMFQSAVGSANTYRIIVPWNAVEASRGEWEFWYYDWLYQKGLDFGLRPIIILNSAPCWAHPSVSCSAVGSQYASVRPDNAYLDEFADYARRVAQRYPAARAIEVWNEPNAEFFWGPNPTGVGYAQLLQAGYQGARAGNPSARVLVGGPSPATPQPWTAWLNKVYDEGGKSFSDGLGLHPYPQAKPLVQNSLAQVDRARQILQSHGAGSDPIWVTEIGLSTSPNVRDLLRVTPNEQAEMLTQIHDGLKARGVNTMIIHRLNEVRHSNAWEAGLALIKYSGEVKPAFCALARARGAQCG